MKYFERIIAGTILNLLLLTMFTGCSDSDALPPDHIELNATVSMNGDFIGTDYTGGSFSITNYNKFPWKNLELTLNSEYHCNLTKEVYPNKEINVDFDKFKNSEGKKFDVNSTDPKKMILIASSDKGLAAAIVQLPKLVRLSENDLNKIGDWMQETAKEKQQEK